MHLDELQRDALGEIFNIGLGRAAASLSQIVQEEILLTAPAVRVLHPRQIRQEFTPGRQEKYSAVAQDFSGPFAARAMLVFPERNALEIVSRMLGNHVRPEEMAEYQKEAMCEIGNIILNACISALADLFTVEFHSTLPVHCFDRFDTLIQSGEADDAAVLLIQVDLVISQQQTFGHILFLMSVSSLSQLIDCLGSYLAKHQLT